MSLQQETIALIRNGIQIPDPEDSSKKINVKVDESYMLPKIAAGLNNDIFDFVYAILGKQPMVNNIGYHEKGDENDYSFLGLPSYTMSFVGVNRPCKRNGEDANIIVLILKPKHRYKYMPDMVCVAKIENVPSDVALAVYLRKTIETNAKIIKWEWIELDEKTGKPQNHEGRYNEELNNGKT